jgi:hypothetical protein
VGNTWLCSVWLGPGVVFLRSLTTTAINNSNSNTTVSIATHLPSFLFPAIMFCLDALSGNESIVLLVSFALSYMRSA